MRFLVLGSLLLSGCALPHYLENGCKIQGNMFTGDTTWSCPKGSYMAIGIKDGRVVSAVPAYPTERR